MEAWQNYLTTMERIAQQLPVLARNLWWLGVQYEGIYYLGDFHWIQSLLFSHPPKFFQLICTFVPLLAVQIICPAVSPVCYANAWLPLCILPPHPPRPPSPLSLFITSLYFYPARDPAYFDSARQFRQLKYFWWKSCLSLQIFSCLMMMSLVG